MEAILLDAFKNAPYGVSFLAGVVTFLSPCILPLLPAYLSYVSGLSLAEIRTSEVSGWALRWRIFRSALLFVLGFSLIFMILGISMARVIGDILGFVWLRYLAGGIIILFGVHLARWLTLPWLQYEWRIRSKAFNLSGELPWLVRGLVAPFLFGISFALGWSPCIGPIFAGIVALTATQESKGIMLMVFYTIGLGIPFLLTALLAGTMLAFLERMKAWMRFIEVSAGILLIVVGVLIITGDLGEFSAWLFIKMRAP